MFYLKQLFSDGVYQADLYWNKDVGAFVADYSDRTMFDTIDEATTEADKATELADVYVCSEHIETVIKSRACPF